MGTAIKHPVPGRVKSFVFLTSGHWVSECLDVKNYKWLLNPVWNEMLYSCTHMATVGIKGLRHRLHVAFIVFVVFMYAYTRLLRHLWFKFRIKRKNELNSVPLQCAGWVTSQQQSTVYNFHMSWCQRNSVGPMKCVQFIEAIVKLSVTVTGVRGLQMQSW